MLWGRVVVAPAGEPGELLRAEHDDLLPFSFDIILQLLVTRAIPNSFRYCLPFARMPRSVSAR